MTNAELIKALLCEKDCDDCAYHTDNAWSRCDEWGMRCDAADAIERLTAQVPRWIPVTERLPENEGRYLAVFYEEMIIDFGYYRPSVGWCEQGITHWMPLPQPPDLT